MSGECVGSRVSLLVEPLRDAKTWQMPRAQSQRRAEGIAVPCCAPTLMTRPSSGIAPSSTLTDSRSSECTLHQSDYMLGAFFVESIHLFTASGANRCSCVTCQGNRMQSRPSRTSSSALHCSACIVHRHLAVSNGCCTAAQAGLICTRLRVKLYGSLVLATKASATVLRKRWGLRRRQYDHPGVILNESLCAVTYRCRPQRASKAVSSCECAPMDARLTDTCGVGARPKSLRQHQSIVCRDAVI